jgi:hypothetical protein
MNDASAAGNPDPDKTCPRPRRRRELLPDEWDMLTADVAVIKDIARTVITEVRAMWREHRAWQQRARILPATSASTQGSPIVELDEDGRNLADRPLWAQAGGLADLGVLMARWLESDITYQPAYCGPVPEDETTDLIPVLAAVNRAGLVTDFSQPGQPLVGGCAQRAAVGGFCDEQMLSELIRATFGTELVLMYFAPNSVSEARVVVTLDAGEEFTWLGRIETAEDIADAYAEDLAPAGVHGLAEAWQVHLFDPVWGRNDLLWPLLADVAARRTGTS